MAKLAGGALGVRRGKVGAEVYSVTGGIQVVKQYQPVVANPNTDGQQIQRLKMMVVGKLSKAIAPSMLTGFGSRFKARAEFNAGMLRAAEARLSGDAGTWKAKVNPMALVFSKGEQPSGGIFGPARFSNNNRTVTLQYEQMPEGWTRIRLIVVGGGRELDISQDFISAMSEDTASESGTISVNLPQAATEGAHAYVVLGRLASPAAQLLRNGGGVENTSYDLDGNDATQVVSAIEWGASQWVDFVGAGLPS